MTISGHRTEFINLCSILGLFATQNILRLKELEEIEYRVDHNSRGYY